jgi:hypothetical protein
MNIFHLKNLLTTKHGMVIGLTSSSKEGNSFLSFKFSEKRPRTLVSPFMNAIFSSCGLAAKVDRSRKLRVEIGNDEKKG